MWYRFWHVMFIISYISTMPLIIHVFYEILNIFLNILNYFEKYRIFLNFETFLKNIEILWNFGKFWNFKIFEIFWNFFMKFWKILKFWNFLGIRYRVCDIGYKRYRLGTIIDDAYTKRLYFNLNIWYIMIT